MVKGFQNKLAVRLIVMLIGIVSLVSLVSVIVFSRVNNEIYRRYLNDSVKNIIDFAKLGYSQPLWNMDYNTIAKINEAIIANQLIVAVNVYNDRNFVVGFRRTEQESGSLEAPFRVPYGKSYLKKKEFAVFSKGMQVGRCELFYTEEMLRVLIQQSNLRMTTSFLIIAVAIVLIVSLGLRKYVIIPISRLSQTTQEVGVSNNYSIRAVKPHNDEIGILYDGFNEMLQQINNRANERDVLEAELKAARNFLKNVINSMPSMLVSINIDGEVTQWNEAAARQTGIAASEAISKKLWEIEPQLHPYKEECLEVSCKKQPKTFHRQIFSNMQSRFFNVSLYPLIENGIVGTVLRIDDVTEIESKENELRQSQKMEVVGTLAGGLAHDFNNVLGGITGTLSLLVHRVKKKPQVQSDELMPFFKMMQESGARAADMVQQLLALSRKQDLTLAPVDLNLALKHIWKICSNSFDKSIELSFNTDDTARMTMADPTQIEQVLLNLCVNAGHAMTIMRKTDKAPGGKLTVEITEIESDTFFCEKHPEAEQGLDYWRVSVQDTGVGMDVQTISRIFDPFFTTKEKGKGTGLGLAMVYNIVKHHRGLIDVYSEEKLGSTFNVYMPVLQREEAVDELSRQESLVKGEGLVLVVDDERLMREVAKGILEESGYEVLLAVNGEEGIDMFKKHRAGITAVLLDMVMPKKSGKETYIAIKEIDPSVKVLLVSGFKQDERVEDLLKLGVDGFVQKPYSLEDLSSALYTVVNPNAA